MSLSRSPPSPLTLAAPFATTAGGNGGRHQLLLPHRSWTNPNLAASTRVGGGASVRCMANQRRVKMVAKQIQRELSDMLLTDKVLQYAVLPEASLGADRYLSSLTTISGVEVSGDLQVIQNPFFRPIRYFLWLTDVIFTSSSVKDDHITDLILSQKDTFFFPLQVVLQV